MTVHGYLNGCVPPKGKGVRMRVHADLGKYEHVKLLGCDHLLRLGQSPRLRMVKFAHVLGETVSCLVLEAKLEKNRVKTFLVQRLEEPQ